MSELGAILRSARHKKNLTVLDVSAATRIKASYLEALEEGEYNQLPGPAYVTGFLRNYASFLGLQPEDIVQEYYATRPTPEPSVKAATRVLATGYQRQMRGRLLWVLGSLVLLLAGGFAVKSYNDYAHADASPINVTATNLGGTLTKRPAVHHLVKKTPSVVHLGLRSLAPVWVRVTVDGVKAYEGLLRPKLQPAHWTGHQAIYVMTLDGSHLRITWNGHHLGLMSARPGTMVDLATPHGVKQVS